MTDKGDVVEIRGNARENGAIPMTKEPEVDVSRAKVAVNGATEYAHQRRQTIGDAPTRP
jgi:hypothetical protein